MTESSITDVLVCVDPDRVGEIWPHVSLFLQSAYERGDGDDNLESLKASLDEKRALLWIVWDGSGILAAGVTRIESHPAKKVCVIAALGGRQLPRWRRLLIEIESYARTEGCDVVRVAGRAGWKAILTDYREPWVCLEKKLKG